jgi:hypothetical protein
VVCSSGSLDGCGRLGLCVHSHPAILIDLSMLDT